MYEKGRGDYVQWGEMQNRGNYGRILHPLFI